jgi:hypothetical protein
MYKQFIPNFSAQFQAWNSTQLCLGMFVFHLQFFLFGIFLSVFFENKTNTQIESGMLYFHLGELHDPSLSPNWRQ